jgi:hypothetical protein
VAVDIIGPYGRSLNQERYLELGSKYGATDYDYYMFADETCWCFESPNNSYSRARWYKLSEDSLSTIMIEGKSLRQIADENRAKLRTTE